MRPASLFLTGLFVLGCSSDNGGLPENHADLAVAPDLSVPMDLTVPPDLTKPPPPDMVMVGPTDADGVACGPMTCGIGQVCCASLQNQMLSATCATSCDADGGMGITVQCDGPEDCPGGNPCCGDVMGLNLPKSIYCTMKPTDCEPRFTQLMPPVGQTRFCHVDADCTRSAPNAPLNQCCTLGFGGLSQHLCLTQMFATIIGQLGMGITATCP